MSTIKYISLHTPFSHPAKICLPEPSTIQTNTIKYPFLGDGLAQLEEQWTLKCSVIKDCYEG
jgi:hypothetical protein